MKTKNGNIAKKKCGFCVSSFKDVPIVCDKFVVSHYNGSIHLTTASLVFNEKKKTKRKPYENEKW